MMVVPMRTRARFILTMVALAQVALLAFSLVFLSLQLRQLRTDLTQLGVEEQPVLNKLNDAESALYRTSILLRDNIILEGPSLQKARLELIDLVARISDESMPHPSWLSTDLLRQIDEIETVKRDYLARARLITAWQEKDRRRLGPQYVLELAPTREKYITTARQITDLVRALRQSRNNAMAQSIEEIETLVLRTLAGATILGVSLLGVAVWRITHYEKEREVHLQTLEQAGSDLRTLSLRLVESQETERKRLSRELHDEVGQILTALRVQLGQIEPIGESSQEHLQRASDLAERSLRSVREMARGLRPAMLDDLGLAPALRWLGRDISKNAVLDVDVQIEGELSHVDESVRTCLYRVAQEALTNCIKHSVSTTARVLLRESPEEILLTVQDNGSGFSGGHAGGIGLMGMRERVEELGGEFAVVSLPGSGTLIRANVPKAGASTKAELE